MGDIYEGYTIPFFINNLFRYTLPKLSENTTLWSSIAISDAFIIAVEYGFIVKDQQPDYVDIPAAFIGNILYILASLASKNRDINLFYNIFKKY